MEQQPIETHMSQSVSKLVAALAKAQGEFDPLFPDRIVSVKFKENKGGYQHKYATLGRIYATTIKHLSDHGVALVSLINDGMIRMRLMYEDEFMESTSPVPSGQINSQDYAKTLTFTRRNLLSALLSIAPDFDDDNNEAEGNHAEFEDPLEKLWEALAVNFGLTDSAKIREWCEGVLGVPIPNPDTITPSQANKLISVATKKEPVPEKKEVVTPSTKLQAKELNEVLDKLAPWGNISDLPPPEASTAKKLAKLAWAKGMLKRSRDLIGFSELSEKEIKSLIEAAKNGEVPSPEELPEWMEKQPANKDNAQ